MSGRRVERMARLRARLSEAGLDGLVVSAPSNIFYLSGFRGSSGALLISSDRAVLFSDFRYRIQAQQQAPECEFREVQRGLLRGVGRFSQEAGLSRVGYDSAHLTCALQQQLAEGASGVELDVADGMVEELRAVKDPAEVELIRKAAALADAALTHMVSLLRPGAVEREVALEGEFFMRREGAEATAFEIIVASGDRSALPHAETTAREIRKGDLVVIDMGARVEGYCSDMTRTFAVGSASSQARDIYGLVYRAQRASAAQVRAGAGCGELDAIARGLIAEAGYGDCFGHGLGHGVGIDVHEAPRLGRDEETELVAGNVVTVEPGIYLEGKGGVRLEDLAAVGDEGAETLTGSTMPPDLPIV